MESAILDKGERYYTSMAKIFQAIGNAQAGYNWLVTNIECCPQDDAIEELFSGEYVWISGEELSGIIDRHDFPWIFGVFSGFSKDILLEDVLTYDLPFADGYEGFWVDNVGIQHPLADLEIVAWDSTLCLFISKDPHLVQQFRHHFPLSEDLSARNKRENAEIAHIQDLLVAELQERGAEVHDAVLHEKFAIWRKLYVDRHDPVNDREILDGIRETLQRERQTSGFNLDISEGMEP